MLATLVALTAIATDLNKAAATTGITLYVPDESAIGYRLSGTEIAELEGRKVVRLTYTNVKVQNSFDLFEYPSAGAVGSGLAKIVDSKAFNIGIMEDDTVVSIRKGKTDVSLVGSLMSNPSAKKMLERVMPFRP